VNSSRCIRLAHTTIGKREKNMKRAIAASLGAALLIGSTAAAGAAPLSPATAAGANADRNVIDVQWRGHHHHHHGWHGGHWRHRHYGYGWGPAIGGLAAGAIIGSAIANSNARTNDAVAYCMNRFKSYDPASGTYLGYDGIRHPCP
jgi:hypothetical protein